ncbi:MAG: hypothetical protein ABFD98_17405 [Syntrophobacteraceae bacterium]|nr:hypothetical protein [Desulfobacteraceae bacterium]
MKGFEDADLVLAGEDLRLLLVPGVRAGPRRDEEPVDEGDRPLAAVGFFPEVEEGGI